MGLSNILLIPGVTDPASEIRSLLFSQGQPGGGWIPSFSQAMIAANTFGSGVTDVLDLSGNNNPFSQATPASRAAWFREPKTGRRQLLEQTEDYGNAYWTRGELIAASADTRIIPSTNSSTHSVSVSVPTIVTGNNYTIRLTCFPEGYAGLRVAVGASRLFVNVNLINGTIQNSGSNGTNWSLTSAVSQLNADGSTTVTIIANAVSIDTASRLFLIGVNASPTFSGTPASEVFIGDGVSGVRIVSQQIETGSTATPYQRVTTAFDVTEAGQRDCYGLQGDGIDDFYQRAIDFSGTDKVTVFAAVRKLSDAGQAALVELRPTGAPFTGIFSMSAPRSAAPNYAFGSAGNGLFSETTTAGIYPAPTSNILTGIGDISGDITIIRINGVQAGENLSDQGSGNYRNDILYLFRRGGTTLPFNGNLYALIVAGGSYPLSTIQRVERILSRITPTVNL